MKARATSGACDIQIEIKIDAMASLVWPGLTQTKLDPDSDPLTPPPKSAILLGWGQIDG